MNFDQVERIRALHRLADRTPFPDEAVSARRKAHYMQVKYEITSSMLAEPAAVRDPSWDQQPQPSYTYSGSGWSMWTSPNDRQWAEAVSRVFSQHSRARVIIFNIG